MRVVYFTSRPLYLRKRTTVPIEQEAEWAPQPVWKFAEKEKKLFRLPVFDPRTVQPNERNFN
jgi:hypothetical protein